MKKLNWKFIAVVLFLIVFWAWVASMCGCATFEYKDAECTIKAATLGKDIKMDPNGLMSTVSPENTGIIEAIAGFVAGCLTVGL